MKNFIKILIANSFVFLILLFIAEYYAFQKVAAQKAEHVKTFIAYDDLKFFNKMVDFDEQYAQEKEHGFRKPVGLDYKKKPVILFGCSYTYGYKLNDNQTFGYYLSEYSKRPVYNRAHNAWGLPQMVYQLSRDDFYNEVPEPEWVIYLFSKHNIQMLYDYTFQLWDKELCLHYKNKNGKLVREKLPPKIIQNSWLYKIYRKNKIKNIYDCIFSDEDEKLTVLYFKTAMEEAKKHWKNVKFIVLFYDETTETEGFDEKLQKDLQKAGFITYKMNDIAEFDVTDTKFRVAEKDPHPSEKLWQLFCPKLAKKLML